MIFSQRAEPSADSPFYRNLRFLSLVSVGVAIGFLSLFAVFLPLRYLLPFLGMIALPITGLLSRNAKFFFQTLLIASFCLPIRKALVAIEHDMHTGGPFGIEVFLTDYLLLILYLIWIYERVYLSRGQGFRLHKIGWFFLGYMSVTLLSFYNASNKAFVFFEFVHQIRLFLLFVYLANSLTDKRVVRMAVTVTAGFLSLHGLFSIAQYVLSDPLYVPYLMPPPPPKWLELTQLYGGFKRTGGIVQAANVSSTWLVMTIPLVFMAIFWPEKRWFRINVAASFVLAMVALIITGTRAGWITLPFAVVLTLYFCFRKGLLSYRRTFPALFAMVLLGVILVLPFAQGIHSRLMVPMGASEYSRIYLIRLSLEMVAAHPLVGNGANNYNISNRPFLRQVYDAHSSLNMAAYHVVHNLWLLIAADTGLLGLFFFLMMLYAYVRNCFVGLRSKDPFVLGLSIALLTSLLNFVLTEMFDWSYAMFGQVYCSLWLLTALSVFVKQSGASPADGESGVLSEPAVDGRDRSRLVGQAGRK